MSWVWTEKFYCEGKVVDITLDEISNSNSAFDFIIESYGNRSLISIDEDGEVIENELCMSFSMECFYNISSESELAELVEEGNIDEDVYEDIERVGVLLA